MRKLKAFLVVFALLPFLGGCVSAGGFGTAGTGLDIGSNRTDHLSIRNATGCDLVVDVDYRQESLVIPAGDKGILPHSFGLVGDRRDNSRTVDIVVSPLKAEGQCALEPATGHWRVDWRRDSNKLWVAMARRDRLYLKR